MFKRKRTSAVLAGVAACALAAITACGSSDDSDTTSTPSASGSAAAHADWPKTLTIGAVPAENAQATISSLTPLANMLKDKLGIDVKITTGTSYSALIEGQKSGKVDIVEYGPFSYYIATHVGGVKLQNVGIVLTDKGTDGGYYSLGLVPKDSSISSIKDFAGKKVCFVDPASTSGYLYPSYGLLDAGIDPAKGVTPVFAGGHDASVLSIAKGTCDAGFAEDVMPPQLIKAGKIADGDVKEVWRSPEIPGSPMAASASLPADLLTALTDAFVNDGNVDALTAAGYCSSADQCTKDMGFWGFGDPTKVDYSAIDKVCGLTKSSKCTQA